jgi:hypothetical protein
MKNGGLVFSCFFFSIVLYAAPALDDTILVKNRIQLLHRIEQLQVKEVQTTLQGAFPSSRKYFFRTLDQDPGIKTILDPGSATLGFVSFLITLYCEKNS